jgi:23S rRNA (cytosine1962-C5)-methyltransferase
MKYSSIVEKACGRRDGLFADPDNTCFRLLNGHADGVEGLAVDRYGEYLVLHYYGKFPRKDAQALVSAVIESLAKRGIVLMGAMMKDRRKPSEIDALSEPEGGVTGKSGTAEILWGAPPPGDYTVRHNGLMVYVDLAGGLHTGLFPDMREIREKLVEYYTRGGSLLNLFCHTGVFSLHALAHGISRCVNVDLSAPALVRARRNYALNGMAADETDFICGDAFRWIRSFEKKNRRFSMVIFDPPTFSRNKRRTFSVKRDYRDYLELLSRLAEGGCVLSAVNAESVSLDEYMSLHPMQWQSLFVAGESFDYRGSSDPYLKAGLWRV